MPEAPPSTKELRSSPSLHELAVAPVSERRHSELPAIQERRQVARLLGLLEVSRPRQGLKLLACVAVALIASFCAAEFAGLDDAPAQALFILVLAAGLWVTEAIPAFAVGILVIGLQVLVLGRPGGAFAKHAKQWEEFVAVLGHPLIWLFFGGFVLASGVARTGMDQRLARAVLKALGPRPARLLAGVMGMTFVLSMFMSNTATTAVMLAVLAPMLRRMEGDPLVKGLLLGLVVAANVGGMGTLIGTPPNAIAAAAIEHATQRRLGFLEWMTLAVPPATLLVLVAYLFISRTLVARSTVTAVELPAVPVDAESVPRWRQLIMMATFALTVLLWMSSEWHGMPTAVVSFIPIIALTSTQILRSQDMRTLPWDVLFLLAGGLALGQVVRDTGLAAWLTGSLNLGGLAGPVLAVLISYSCVLLSNFMSNTAAANVLVPIGVTLAGAAAAPAVAFSIAMGASSAMLLPIATPPNAMVFSTGFLTTRDFLKIGALIGILGPALAALWCWLIL